MEEKSNSVLRRYHLIHPSPSDQQDRTNSTDFQHLIPLDHGPFTLTRGSANKRRRCSITTESSLSTLIASHDPDLIFDRSLPTTAAAATPSGASKRSAQDDTAALFNSSFPSRSRSLRKTQFRVVDGQASTCFSLCCSRTNELAMNIHEVSN